MNALKKKYHGKTLSTDEVAEAHNAIRKATQEPESISFKTGGDYLLLKWGTVKYFGLKSKKAHKLWDKYCDLGFSISAISQHNTSEQKELICQMIDDCNGIIQSDWTGEYLTKQQAKDYIMEYGDD